MINLSDEQHRAVDGVLTALRSGRRTVAVGGYAGTGKTTIIHALVEQLGGDAVVVAPTGKAAEVLRSKGNDDAKTLHSLMYYRPRVADGELVFDRRRGSVDADVVIVDESSMVSRKLFADLLDFGVQAILVGDHGQLEPVGDQDGWRNPTFDPDFALETIHRNAGPIARFADHLRHEQSASTFHDDTGAVVVTRQLDNTTLLAADQVICAWNNQRRALNVRIRELRGMTSTLPRPGDRVISLESKNGLTNGQQAVVVEVGLKHLVLDHSTAPIRYDACAFVEPCTGAVARDLKAPHRFDYAYAITAHKAQGSEWDRVVVCEPRPSKLWTQWRWNYTAATRARKQLTWVLP